LQVLERAAGLGCQVIACLRGVARHDVFRCQPDISDVQVLRQKSVVPIVVDPSHMAGDYRYVENLAQQAIIAGADGIMVEVSDHRSEELTDGSQAVDSETFWRIVSFARQYKSVAVA